MPKWLTVSLLAFSLLLIALGIAFYPTHPTHSQSIPADEMAVNPISIHMIGTIDPDPFFEQQQFAPLIEFLNEHLAKHHIRLVTRIPKSPKELDELIRTDQLHWIIDSPAPIGKAAASHPLIPQLIRHKDNRPTYYSIIAVRNDSGIHRLEDLKGKTLGIENKWSTSTYALPAIGLQDAHLTFSLHPTHPEESVTLIATGDENISINEVLAGNITAAAVKSSRYEELSDARFSQLKIIYQSSPVPRQIIASVPGLPPHEVQQIIQELVNASQFPQGRKALKKFGKTEAFTRIKDPEKLQQLLDRLALVP